MKNLTELIIEKLKLNSNSKIRKKILEYNPKDFKPYRIKKPSGEEYLWFKFWKYLIINGPITKKDLLSQFDYDPNFGRYLFKELEKNNIIVSIGDKLEAKEFEEWNKID